MNFVFIHLAAFILGFIIDLVLGDPRGFIHPVVIIGKRISFLDKKLYHRDEKKALLRGKILVVIVVIITFIKSGLILLLAYKINVYLGFFIEALMTWTILATKSLKRESMRVYRALSEGDLPGARIAVSMIVGRDTEVLDREGVTKATIETVAENTSDGVIAPMIYTAIGGPVLGYFYKSINTMDSMIGYKNERYFYFGKAAAKLDDFVNYIPSRIAAGFMILAAFLGRDFDGENALRIYKRDKDKSKSPNASKCESVCAGALGIELLGDAVYFGKIVKKETIGDKRRNVNDGDIILVNRLMYMTAFISMAVLSTIIFMIGMCAG